MGLEVLPDCSNLWDLRLYGQKFDHVGAAALAEALKTNSTIGFLSHWSNPSVGDAGIVAIAEALKLNQKIRQMDINENGFGDEGAAAIAEMLEFNSSLRTLSVSRNQISEAG